LVQEEQGINVRRLAIGFYALVWMGAACAADKPEIGPVPSWVQPYQWRPDAGPKTEAAVKVLLIDQQLDFSAAGDESYTENVVKIQTPQGLGAMGTLTLRWNPATDTMIVHKVHIVRGDQVIDVLAGKEPFTILRREDNLEYASLDGVLTAVIQPPGLQIGRHHSAGAVPSGVGVPDIKRGACHPVQPRYEIGAILSSSWNAP
jgi:hypothetical protein